MAFLWAALNEKPKSPHTAKAMRIYQRIAKVGWAFSYEVEDILCALDSRLVNHQLDLVGFSKILGIKWEKAFYRPKANSSGVTGSLALRAEDVALFLMTLEKIGFQVDASGLVNLLLPAVKSRKKKLFTDAELGVFWFEKWRHKQERVSFTVEGSELSWRYNRTVKHVKTNSDYEISLEAGKGGDPTALRISAPKYRKRKRTETTICPDCGVQWSKGDPESSAAHRREHKLRMVYMDPHPCELFLQAKNDEAEPELVTFLSPEWKHAEMYVRALAFKREFHYDFVQWKSPLGIDDVNVKGFLFADATGAIVGACSFREKKNEQQVPQWALEWIWICPMQRRNGHLAKRWAMLRSRFGNFVVEPPVSDALKSFLEKQGDLDLMGIR